MTAVFILAAVAIVIASPRAALPTIESAKALTLTLISRLVLPPAESALPTAPAAAGPELQPAAPAALPTAVPVRTRWEFGELLPYVVQSGDTLPALAARFNQTTDAILKANPALAVFQSTLPPGRAINIPASYAPLLGSAFHMLPDSAVVYAEAPGNLAEQLQNFDGWVAHRHEPAYSARDGSWDEARPSWDLINEVALQYSVNPRVLLALLEYRSGLLRNADPPAGTARNPLRLPPDTRTGMANQLEWAAAQLNDGYYAWRAGTQVELRLLDGSVQRIDPWQNAGTVALLQWSGRRWPWPQVWLLACAAGAIGLAQRRAALQQGRQHKGRHRLADQRRGDLARLQLQATRQEQGQHGKAQQGDQRFELHGRALARWLLLR